MKKIFAMLPCYNEEENIGSLIDAWMKQREKLLANGFSLLVGAIDDCSKDETKKVIVKKQKQYLENVRLIVHETNKGLCGGLNTSIHFFLENAESLDLMVLMDGDNTHNPDYVHNMVATLIESQVDCVIASRYCSDSAIKGVARHREWLSDMAKIYYQIVLRVPNVKDYTCGYRIYTYQCIERLVKKFGDSPIKEKSFACMMELLYKVYLSGSKFSEIGFCLRYDNKKGESKMRVFKTMKNSLITALKLRHVK